MSTAPQWFTDALTVPEAEHSTMVGRGPGCLSPVGRRAPQRRGARAWRCGPFALDHIAPMLTRYECVVALDLSGHGESERRPTNDKSTWAEEVIAVLNTLGSSRPPSW